MSKAIIFLFLCYVVVRFIYSLVGSTMQRKNEVKQLKRFQAEAIEREAVIDSLSVADFSFSCFEMKYAQSEKLCHLVQQRKTDNGTIYVIEVEKHSIEKLLEYDGQYVRTQFDSVELSKNEWERISKFYSDVQLHMPVELTVYVLQVKLKDITKSTLFESYRLPRSFITERHDVPYVITGMQPYGVNDYQMCVDRIKEHLRGLKKPYEPMKATHYSERERQEEC